MKVQAHTSSDPPQEYKDKTASRPQIKLAYDLFNQFGHYMNIIQFQIIPRGKGS